MQKKNKEKKRKRKPAIPSYPIRRHYEDNHAIFSPLILTGTIIDCKALYVLRDNRIDKQHSSI